MAFMQRAHRWHQGQPPVSFQCGDGTAQWIKLPQRLHQRIPLDKTLM